MTDWTQRQVDRQDTQVWLPLGAFLLSIRAQVLGVLLRSTENSMRRRTQHSGGWGGERGGGKREYKHNLMSHIQTQSSVGGGVSLDQSVSVCSAGWGQCGWSSGIRQTLHSPALLQPGGCCAGTPLKGPEADRSLSHSSQPNIRTKVTPSSLRPHLAQRTHLSV